MKYGKKAGAITSVLSILTLGILIGLLAGSKTEPVPPLQTLPAFAATTAAADNSVVSNQSAAALEAQFSAAVKHAMPAVVSVLSSKTVKVEDNLPNDPFLRRFFGDMMPENAPPQKERGLGSGVILSSDGYIVTNNHVVDGADQVEVRLPDKTDLKAKVVGADAASDLALLKIEGESYPYLAAAGSGSIDVGDIVFAIGNPFGVGQTVTMGIVSATGRGNLGIEDYEDFIQTDAAINPGNSGGALINANGQLVGINTAIIGRSGGNDGIGFAIPVQMAEKIIGQLRQNGSVTRGYIGAYIQDVSPEIASAFNAKDTNGALVSDVSPDGPGAKAGLKRGDIITAVDGQPIQDGRRLRLLAAGTAPGTTVHMTVVRNGAELHVPVTLGKLPGAPEGQANTSDEKGNTLRGLNVQPLTPDIRDQLGLEAGTTGVVVSGVDGGAATDAGLQRGDVIQEVDRQPVRTPAELSSAFERDAGKSALLLVNRGGKTFFAVLPAE